MFSVGNEGGECSVCCGVEDESWGVDDWLLVEVSDLDL